MYAQLLIDLFKFLSPFLRNADLTKPTHFLYKVRFLCILYQPGCEKTCLEGMFYLCSENNGADGNCAADLRLCFRICKMQVVS